jgi:hypothetical protein
MIAIVDHQPPLDRTDAALDETGMLIEHQAFDPGIGQERLRPGQPNEVVGAQQFFHRRTPGSLIACDDPTG